MTYMIKRAGDWEIDVLAAPFGSPTNLDSQGEYFSPQTKFHEDKYPLPPAVYYHGFDPDSKQLASTPVYVGKSLSRRVDNAGVWLRVLLDQTNRYAKKIWEAVPLGKAVASTGSIIQLARVKNGHILEWPIIELSIWDNLNGDRPQSHRHAMAFSVAKSLLTGAGLSLPDNIQADPQATLTGARGIDARVEADPPTPFTSTTTSHAHKKGTTMTPEELAQLADLIVAKQATAPTAPPTDWAIKNRLPSGTDLETSQAPYQMKFAEFAKYDNIDPASQALLVTLLGEGQRSGRSRNGASDTAMKALALKIAESTEDEHNAARYALKSAGFNPRRDEIAAKANELNRSTLASYGDDWVVTSYSTDLWRRIVPETSIVGNIPAITIPNGVESLTIPLDATPTSFYTVAQAASQDSNPGPITRTVRTSRAGTSAPVVMTPGKLGASTYYTGELEEDSMIPWIVELRNGIAQEALEVLEHVVIDGDTAAGASTNINDIAGTPSDEAFMLFNGFRKLALVTNSANSRAGGTFELTDFLETLKLMGLAGRNAMDKQKVDFITDAWTSWKSLELAELKTRDVFSQPTIEKGVMTNIYGHKVHASAQMHRANQDATYGLKANTSGKVNLDTASANTTGSLLAVRWDQWRIGYKRRITFETVRVPSADSTELIALLRVALVNRDAEASAITYGLTL